MNARPRLAIRYGKGGIISPESTAGYIAQFVFTGTIVGVLVVSALRAGRTQEQVLAITIGAFLLFIVTRDLVAWVRASPTERGQFRADVQRAREDRASLRRVPTPMTKRECAGYVVLLAVTLGFFGLVLARAAVRDATGRGQSAAVLSVALLLVWFAGSWMVVRQYQRQRAKVSRS